MRTISWWAIEFLIAIKFPDVKQLSTENLAQWRSDNSRSDPLLLDARTNEEYRVSHLLDAKLVPSNLKDLVESEIDYTTPIVVYCSVGYRSSAIARRLKSLGYENVFNLSGSIFQWVNENRSVYREGKQVTTVHPYHQFWQYLLVSQKYKYIKRET